MPMNDEEIRLVDESAAAEILGVKRKTLQGWRWSKSGPAYVKVGRLVRYRLSDLKDFLDRQTINVEGATNEYPLLRRLHLPCRKNHEARPYTPAVPFDWNKEPAMRNGRLRPAGGGTGLDGGQSEWQGGLPKPTEA